MSSNEPTCKRRLEDGEPDAPTSAVIATADGRRVVCAVTQEDRSTWIARPPWPYHFQEGDRFLVDRIPAGGTVEFIDLIGPDSEGWSGRSATRPAT